MFVSVFIFSLNFFSVIVCLGLVHFMLVRVVFPLICQTFVSVVSWTRVGVYARTVSFHVMCGFGVLSR